MSAIKILAVDDEEDLCEILKFNLEIEGYEVDTAFSAEEALKLDLTQYSLLLLDVMMGEQHPHHFPDRQGYGKRYADGIQPRRGRLYLQAFLYSPGHRPCQGRIETDSGKQRT